MPTEPSLMAQPSKQKQCAEMLLEYLLSAMVRLYREREKEGGPTVQSAIDAIGCHLGGTLAERFGGDKSPMLESLDVMKWVCKDLWMELFGKTVDNLRTNHRGTFVLRDTQFRWTMRLAQNLIVGGEKLSGNALASDFLILPAGIIRGALEAFGYESTVTVDAMALPQCDFTVVITQHQNGGQP